ncbi:hypothetical protein [Acidicapsa ligni]|uniref:hypothetical protein n=1 Tax=Acidicapsa ligni TaxID=542300 RepID=UPI0021DF70A6|nr:hypothetical protein [Acidicapsa ligni]
MSERDMAVLVQTLLHYLSPQNEIPSLEDILKTIQAIQTRHPGYDEGPITTE